MSNKRPNRRRRPTGQQFFDELSKKQEAIAETMPRYVTEFLDEMRNLTIYNFLTASPDHRAEITRMVVENDPNPDPDTQHRFSVMQGRWDGEPAYFLGIAIASQGGLGFIPIAKFLEVKDDGRLSYPDGENMGLEFIRQYLEDDKKVIQ